MVHSKLATERLLAAFQNRSDVWRMAVKFDAAFYDRYRPSYPKELFSFLREVCASQGLVPGELDLADIGCGAGHGTLGLIEAGLARELVCVDADQTMIDMAKKRVGASSSIRFICAPGEDTKIEDESCDAIFCASAFHWMDRQKASLEFARILRKPAVLFFAEYSFPQAEAHQELNEWIRSKLRGEWQSPELKNRVPFFELVREPSEAAGFSLIEERSVPMKIQMSQEHLFGLLQSQSRIIRFKGLLASDSEREAFDQALKREIDARFRNGSDLFDFNLAASVFVRKMGS